MLSGLFCSQDRLLAFVASAVDACTGLETQLTFGVVLYSVEQVRVPDEIWTQGATRFQGVSMFCAAECKACQK